MSRVLRRVLTALVVVIGVTLASFATSELLPGDPARMLLGPQASAADVARARELFDMDGSPLARYRRYLGRLVHFGPRGDLAKSETHASCAEILPGLHVDLGYSFTYRRPVVALLAARIPRSFELALFAIVVQALGGGLIGAFAGARRGTRADELAMGATLTFVSAPTFLVGLVLQYVFAYRLHALPYDGYGASLAEHARSIVLPGLTLGVFGAALTARLVREEVAAGMELEIARFARAKGASKRRVVFVHVLRASLLPVATLVALDFGALVSGAIVTEKVFRWPGVGQMAVDAVLNRDAAAVFGTVLFSATAIVIVTTALDLAAPLLDPRLRR